MDHTELESLAESTEKKVRQVIYRMLQQVGIVDSVSNPYILIPNLSTKVKGAIIKDDSKWLTCFLQIN
jgi:CO dehydrogenase/acetyl-CoA synthase gamma subunit (corrinoid Fe-S protein)